MKNKLMMDDAADRSAWAYVRLSRKEELEGGESMAEKFEIRKGICRTLADEHGLLLPDDQIVVEQKSGSKLQTREGMMKILGVAHAKRLPNLITPYVDRLLRGDKTDEQTIEDAFVLGNVKVYTTEQSHPIVFDADYDPTLFEIKSFIARSELRGTIRKRRMADNEKIDRGQRVCGHAPYGYQYLRPVLDEYGRRVAPARHVVVDEEWPIVCEAMRRARDESLRSICADFNARGIPGPAVGRRAGASTTWRHGSLRQIVLNPFYAGYLSRQGRMVRGKRIAAKPADFILSKTKGDWPTVHLIEDWQEIVAIFAGRKPTTSRERTQAATGILFNFCGNQMHKAGYAWGCRCPDPEYRGGSGNHAGTHITVLKVQCFIGEVVAAIVRGLPVDAVAPADTQTGTRADESRKVQAARLVAVNRELAEHRRNGEEMMTRMSFFIDRFGPEQYDSAAAKIKADTERLTREAAMIQAVLAEATAPDPAKVLPALMRFRKAQPESSGFADFWYDIDESERRQITCGIIRRIDLDEPTEKKKGSVWIPGAKVTLWAWVAALLPSDFKLPPMRRFYRKPGFDWHECRRMAKERRAQAAS